MTGCSHQLYEAGPSTPASSLIHWGHLEVNRRRYKLDMGSSLAQTYEVANDTLDALCRDSSVSLTLCAIRNKKSALTLLCASKSSHQQPIFIANATKVSQRLYIFLFLFFFLSSFDYMSIYLFYEKYKALLNFNNWTGMRRGRGGNGISTVLMCEIIIISKNGNYNKTYIKIIKELEKYNRIIIKIKNKLNIVHELDDSQNKWITTE